MSTERNKLYNLVLELTVNFTGIFFFSLHILNFYDRKRKIFNVRNSESANFLNKIIFLITNLFRLNDLLPQYFFQQTKSYKAKDIPCIISMQKKNYMYTF